MKTKKSISILLTVIFLIASFGSTASAVNIDSRTSYELSSEVISNVQEILTSMNDGRIFTIDQMIPLKGLSDKTEYVMLTFDSKGYAIVSLETGTLVEALPDGYNPYLSAKGDFYYAGPLNYLYKDSSNKLFTVRENKQVAQNEIVDRASEIIQIRNSEIAQQRANLAPLANPASFTVSYDSYIRNSMPFGNNVNGTCGSVAAGMMLTCLDRYVWGIGKIVPITQPYGESLHQSLIPYCEKSYGTMPGDVSSGINNWLTYNAANNNTPKIVTAHSTLVVGQGNAETSIANNKACVVSLAGILSSPFGNHMVLAYSYYSNTNGYYYIAHIGWQGAGYTNYIINRAWASGAIWIV